MHAKAYMYIKLYIG